MPDRDVPASDVPTGDVPGRDWDPAHYRVPVDLVCLAGTPDTDRVYASWAGAPGRNVRVGTFAPDPAAIGGWVAGRPYALVAAGAAVADALAVAPALVPAPVRLFVVGAAPPRGTRPSGIPVSVLDGRDDPGCGPDALAGWERLSAAPFTVQLFDGGADVLTRYPDEVLASLQQDLRVAPTQVPGHGFDLVGAA
jgi:hypothetical protein